MEALLILVVSSLVLSVALPIASRSVRDNLRIGARGLDAQEAALQETLFRTLLAAAMPAAATPDEPTATEMLQGESDRLSFSVVMRQPAGCVAAGEQAAVELRIVQRSTLQCVAGERSVTLLRLPQGSELAFEYSADGTEWRNDWPERHLARNDEGIDEARLFGPRPPVQAPLVRLTLLDSSGRARAWLERAGGAIPVEVSPATFEAVGREPRILIPP